MTDQIDTSADYIDRIISAAPFADNDAGIPEMVALIQALAAERDQKRVMDADIAWLIEHVTENAEICSAVNGPDDEATREDRRVETTVRRLVREAGYDVQASAVQETSDD